MDFTGHKQTTKLQQDSRIKSFMQSEECSFLKEKKKSVVESHMPISKYL